MSCELSIQTPPHSTKAWVQVFRPFSYTASIIPVLLGAALTLYLDQSSNWLLLPLIVIASVLLQAGTNLVSEYFDYKKGVDRPETYGSSRVLVEQLLNPLHVLIVGMACFAMTAAIGLVFITIVGVPIFIIGVIGLAGGFFYTATPAAYKYVGLGDLFVFCLMGPLMAIGSFLVLTGGYSADVLLISLPVGFLVAAILSGNNLRDIYHDTQAKINTAATLLGHRWARWEYTSLIVAAYVAMLVMVGFGVLPWWSLLTLLTAPIAIKNIKTALTSRPDDPEAITMLDIQTAQLHMPFGLLLIISVLLGAWL
ncbi:MAG: 1,4-dihydroxy-2-naphthoate octaprenyltransferase [Planctomycetota bacterium]|jgi:1,4-dihydroxy-2-naphthoate octaprenyltransferase